MKKMLLLLFIVLVLTGCENGKQESSRVYTNVDRLNSIPTDIVKGTPENDEFPPILHSDEYEKPIPLPIISTAGAEDSPFIPADRDELYFVFVKDVREDVHVQIRDIVNGIWMSKWANGKWQEPELVVLQKENTLALNGCAYVEGNEMYFCTAREGYTGLHWFRAEYVNGKWCNWKIADFKPEYEVGELHIRDDEIYYHSPKEGGKGEYDMWMMDKTDGKWSNPKNVQILNSEYNEGWPYITPDGKELWFNKQYKGTPAVYRSKKIDGEWTEPELIISQFAGEPTLDKYGNVYFVHHYFRNGEMIEADIYVAYKKKNN